MDDCCDDTLRPFQAALVFRVFTLLYHAIVKLTDLVPKSVQEVKISEVEFENKIIRQFNGNR